MRTIRAGQIQSLFAGNIRKLLEECVIDYEKLYEIRLRTGRPVFLCYGDGEKFLRTGNGMPYRVTRQDLKETLEYISGYSLYAYEDEICQGYLSVQGGHRVGITGKVILDGEHIRGMKYISCINVRLAHQVQGCADEVLPYIRNGEQVYHTLIIAPPRCGKTTLLRDMIRQISNGTDRIQGKTVGVVDERSELAGCYQGIPQNDLGMRTDVLDACPKAKGMQMLLRSMSPDVVAVDELGKKEDFKAVESVVHCGCKLFATAHGNSLEDILRQPFFQKLRELEVFERYIVLGKKGHAGSIEAIYDGKLVGAVLIIFASAGLGYLKSRELMLHEKNLEEFLQVILCLKGEIRCGNSSLSDALRDTACRCRGRYEEFLERVAACIEANTEEKLSIIFQNCTENYLTDLKLDEDERRKISLLGEKLCYLDLEMQVSTIQIYVRRLKLRMEQTEKESHERLRMYPVIGAFSGVLICLLLV